jgi:hypothetical protein
MDDHIVSEAQVATSTGHRTAWRSWLASPALRTLAVFLPAAAGFAIAQVDRGGDTKFTTSGEFFRLFCCIRGSVRLGRVAVGTGRRAPAWPG